MGTGTSALTQFTEPPPPPPLTDTTRIWITGGPGGSAPEAADDGSAFQGQTTWDQGHPDEPPPGPGSDATAQAGFGSRGNRLINGIRSRLLFPDWMSQAIDERKIKFAARIKPIDALEGFWSGRWRGGPCRVNLPRTNSSPTIRSRWGGSTVDGRRTAATKRTGLVNGVRSQKAVMQQYA